MWPLHRDVFYLLQEQGLNNAQDVGVSAGDSGGS